MVGSLSVFFPAYGDEGTIETIVLDAIKAVKESQVKDFEIIVIDDCSPDKSGEIADRLAERFDFVKVVHHPQNRGYGGALKSGFKAASKDWVFYTDGDAQYNVADLKKLVERAGEADVVNGFKTNRADKLYRKVLGNLYNWGSRFAFGIKIKDIDCDFRLMKRKIFDQVKLESDSGVICVEMIKKIQSKGFTFSEVPVTHYPRISGQSQFFKITRLVRVFKGLAGQWVKLVLLRRV